MIFGSTQLLLTTTLLRMTTGDLTENRQKLTYLQLSLAEASPYSETNTFGAPETSVILNKINRLLNKQICLIKSPPHPMGPLSTPSGITLIIGVFPKIHCVSVSRVSF